MFGEDESESPRIGSPWDSLLSLPSSSSSASTPPTTPRWNPEREVKVYSVSLPKLVPEADAGNVEYKLQLIEPTPERFLRLVTQLKWRLLEGGGQAFYELGVADSGQLVGLTRENLDRSLETLEMMAGEIGASVIVVKEIEVPSSMFESATRDGKVSTDVAFKPKKERKPSTHTLKKCSILNAYRVRPSEGGALEISHRHSFSMEEENHTTTDAAMEIEDFMLTVHVSPESDYYESHAARQASREILSRSDDDDGIFALDLDLTHFSLTSSSRVDAVQPGNSELYQDGHSDESSDRNKKQKPDQTPRGDKAARKRAQRDERRERRVAAIASLHKYSGIFNGVPTDVVTAGIVNSGVDERCKDLSDLQVKLEQVASDGTPQIAVTTMPVPENKRQTDGWQTLEPRLIVEALVVRKLSTEEAFLDFGGFSLND